MSNDFLCQKVLVTGASGFIGSHLCGRLCREGAEVHAVSRTNRANYENGLNWWHGDLAEIGVIRDLVTKIKPDVIFHLAGYPVGARELPHVMPSFICNLTSTVNLLVVASEVGCRRIVLIGSMEEPDNENSQAIPCSPYAVSKWAGSAYGRMFHALYQLPVVILRIFMVYGPGQQDLKKLIPYVILSLLRGESPKLSSGQREIDWIYVEDVVEGLLAASQASDIEGNTIDIGSGELISIKSVVERVVGMMNSTIIPRFGAFPDRQLEQIRVADTARSAALIGWKPKISMGEGLERTLSWYRQKFNEGSI
jgi:nucleoside-diphosphate-sugar epimerase